MKIKWLVSLILLISISTMTLGSTTKKRTEDIYATSVSIICPGSPVQTNVNQTITICYANNDNKIHQVDLYLTLSPDAVFVSASDIRGVPGVWEYAYHRVHWNLINVDYLESGCATVTCYFTSMGTKVLIGRMDFRLDGLFKTVVDYCSTVATTETVTYLLRYNGVTDLYPLTPPGDIIFPLNITRDLENYNFTSGSYFPSETLDYSSDTPPLVFYQIPIDTDTLRVVKDNTTSKVVITF